MDIGAPTPSTRSRSHRSTSPCRRRLRLPQRSRPRSPCRRELERLSHRADRRVAALACAPPRRCPPARVLHLASRELARRNPIRSGVLDPRRRCACRGPRMRHLRLQDKRARRRSAPALHGVRQHYGRPNQELPPLRQGCPIAIGRVSLWGRILARENGFRAQYAYPYELFLIGGEDTLARELRGLYAVDVWPS